jgi:hypothetical protein
MTNNSTTIGELEFAEDKRGVEPNEEYLWTAATHLGRLSVLYRYMGLDLGHNYESGFKPTDGGWFLRQDYFDIRRFPALTIEQAIAKIKAGEDEGKESDE